MNVIDEKKVSKEHSLFYYHGYWKEVFYIKSQFSTKPLRSIYNDLEDQLSVHGFSKYPSFEGFKKEYYRYLKVYRKNLK